MMWLPEQSRRATGCTSVDAAIAARARSPARSTCSSSTRTRRSRKKWRARRWSLAPDDDAAAMYLEAMERLDTAGFEQCEISNVAQSGRRSGTI